ncbi:hypothetical protein SISNIDRAFT_491748 [Sistotremastrum niveocremeum HHB9708]|nr:hypothetical protein SISNIDRAFT_491748 [Sistotremastrum niveocremeum HHB9708]
MEVIGLSLHSTSFNGKIQTAIHYLFSFYLVSVPLIVFLVFSTQEDILSIWFGRKLPISSDPVEHGETTYVSSPVFAARCFDTESTINHNV